MGLNEYLKKHRISQTEFGRKLGLSQTAVSKLTNGRRNIDVGLVVRIEQITQGHVTFKDWKKVVRAK